LTEKDRLALRAIIDEAETDPELDQGTRTASSLGGSSRTPRSRSTGSERGGAAR
jgi:hypothetical protein